jgi:hypothetical protein
MRDLNPDALDRWITGNWGADQYPDPPADAEDYLGLEVFIPEEDQSGTIDGWEEWEDEDEDGGRYGGFDLEIELADRRRITLSRSTVDDLIKANG